MFAGAAWRLCYGEGAGYFDWKTAVFPTFSISTTATCVETAVGVAVVQAASHNKIKSKRGGCFYSFMYSSKQITMRSRTLKSE